MNNYKGVIIEESLANRDVLKKVKILSTKVEKINDEHKTPMAFAMDFTYC